MRTRDRPNFGKNKKLVRTTTISVALFVAAIMIFSSIPTIATPGNTTKMNKIGTDTTVEEVHSTGLPPQNQDIPLMATDLNSGPVQQPLFQEEYVMYMEHAVGGGGAEHFSIDTANPGDIYEDLGNSIAGDFLAGGTYGCDYIWYGCEYATGVLWGMDLEGDMWSIGGGGGNLNALAWDPIFNRLYGCGSVGYSDTIVELDPDTGEQDDLFTIPYSGGLLIGMAFDEEGTLFGWELVTDKLWIIDIEDESAEEVGPLGININFAQDGDIHRESNTLFLAAYSGGGKLYKCSMDDGSTEFIGNLPNNWECTCACFENECVPPEHDVGVKKILAPTTSGHAVEFMDMKLLVKNFGNNTETFDAQMEIIKCEDSGEFLLEEDFSGDVFPPENWTTDYWKKGYSNYASGESPEAMVYKYDQYYGGQYYDNELVSCGFDATGWEKLTMDFRFAGDMTYPQYCAFYVKWRRNETSSWKDVSPWDNPLNEQKEGDLYEIDCYGFGEELGENFSIQFKYQGYYYYYNYFYIDDIKVEGCGGCAEYAELEKDITLDPGEEAEVTFPGWTPSEWHNESYQHDWEDYPVHGFTIMEGDQRPRNDDKWHLLELYYPWFYDIEVTEIGEPAEKRSIPARTFDVEATIKNVGQFDMCCIATDISIGAPVILDTLASEYDWDPTGHPGWSWQMNYYPGYATGWRDEHKKIQYYYGWERRTYSPMSGGDAPEAFIRYYRCRADHVFSSGVIDSSEAQSLQLSFLSYVNHFSGQGLYQLEAGYSHDGETWHTAWSESPSSSGNYEVGVPIEGGSETTYIGFWVKGNPYYFNYWHIDNVKVEEVGLIGEYTDFACQGDDLPPGSSRTFYFDPWTPDFLAEEETAWEVPYKAECSIEVEGDMAPGNDICVNDFKLDYWHDCGIDRVSSPAVGREMGGLLWDNGDTDGFNGYSILPSPKRTLLDDFEVEGTWQIDGLKCFCVAGPVNTPEVSFWDDDDNEPGESIGTVEFVEFNRENTGRSWFGYSEWEYQYEFEPFPLDEGRWWVEIGQTSGSNTFIMVKQDYVLEQGWYNYADYGMGPFEQLWGTKTDMAWSIYGSSGGPPGISVYIQPGTEPISAIAKNYGTFPELDLNCHAEIWEYITDPENGTKLYEDDELDIDLDEPLGGEEQLDFDPFTFANEGRYGLFLDMPDANDDVTKNNKKSWGIGVDNTDPVSSHVLDPAIPDGENGWYVSDLEVTLTAYDPLVEDVSSGVKELKYQIGTGPIETIAGHTGIFSVKQEHDDEDIVITYWAIDNVGNDEPANTIEPYIDMDQTDPTIDLTYEWEGNEMTGYDIFMTATASDDTSGMDRVEFFLNEGLQEIVAGPGPTYEWSFKWYGDIDIAIRVDGYDIAGNMASDIVDPIENFEFSQDMQQAVKVYIK
jgi:hypothetical protein